MSAAGSMLTSACNSLWECIRTGGFIDLTKEGVEAPENQDAGVAIVGTDETEKGKLKKKMIRG